MPRMGHFKFPPLFPTKTSPFFPPSLGESGFMQGKATYGPSWHNLALAGILALAGAEEPRHAPQHAPHSEKIGSDQRYLPKMC